MKKYFGHKTRKDIHLKFYKTMVLSCRMHGSETWDLRRQFEAAEMRFVLYAAGTRKGAAK
jgi:hypothetical protein